MREWRERREQRTVTRLSVIICALLLWHIYTSLFLSSFTAPEPLGVAQSLFNIVTSEVFFSAVTVTSFRVLKGALITIILGSILVFLAVYNDVIDSIVYDVVFPLIYSVPGLLWVLIILVMLGLSPITPIIIIVLMSMPHFILNITEGKRSLDYDLIEVGEVFGDKELSIIQHTLVPQLYPNILAGTRSVMTRCWKGIIVAELFGATSGIGYQVNSAYQVYDINTLAAWTVITLVILVGTDKVLKLADKRFLRKNLG